MTALTGYQKYGEMMNRFYRIWTLLPLLLAMTACQLGKNQEIEATITSLPPQQAAVATNTPFTPIVSTATPRPTDKPVVVVPTSAPLPACSPRTNWPTYTVQQGDTLSAIARRTNSNANDIANANCLSNPNAISAGQVLYVPSAPVPPTLTAAPPPADGGYQTPPCQGQTLRDVGLRAGPSENYGIVTNAPAGFNALAVERSGTGWLRIIVPGTSQNTWINAALFPLPETCRGPQSLPLNSAGTTPGNATFTDTLNHLAFDYPAAWYNEFNTDGLPGGMVGTFTWNMMPPTVMGWTSEMVIVAYVVYPDDYLAGKDIATRAQEDVANVRAQNNRIGVAADPTACTIGALACVTYELTGPGVGKVYYFNINGKIVQFTVTGSYDMGVPVLNTLRQI